MRPTRRYWELIGIAVTLVASALVFDQPLLIAGAAALFGWLIAMQVAFVMALAKLDASLTVEQSLTQPATVIDDPVPVTLHASGSAPGVDVTVRFQLPAGVALDGTDSIPLGETTVASVTSPIAGVHTLAAPIVTIADTSGLFAEELQRGPACDLTVQPREPKRVHIGAGGDTIPIAFGEHTVDTGESGLVPAELREYTGGESVSRIDWKATARLSTPHIREFEAESDVTTILVVDRRGRLATGPPGETAFAYLRSAALSYLAVVQSLGDPVGCFAIGETQVEQLVAPTSSTHGYESIRRQLQTVAVESSTHTDRRPIALRHRSPMFDQTTTFGRTLAAYANPSTTTPVTDPLSAAVRRAATTQQGTVQLAVFTDDSDHAALRNAVAEAKRANVRLTVFLAPQLLYGSPTGVESGATTERYQEFEQLRRRLAATEGITAYEVAPRERIERVLETQSTINTR